jgi:hypothetical protein
MDAASLLRPPADQGDGMLVQAYLACRLDLAPESVPMAGVGLRSVREWAIRQGGGGRPVRQEQAQGILVAALRCECPKVGAGSVNGLLGGTPCGNGEIWLRPPRRAMLDTGMSCGAPA